MNLKEIFAEFTIDVDEKYLFIYFLNMLFSIYSIIIFLILYI